MSQWFDFRVWEVLIQNVQAKVALMMKLLFNFDGTAGRNRQWRKHLPLGHAQAALLARVLVRVGQRVGNMSKNMYKRWRIISLL